MKEETGQPFILDFDGNHHAVLEPDFEDLPFHFHPKLLYAFVPKEEIDSFLDRHPHRTLGSFRTISFRPKIYEVKIENEYFTLCQAPLGAPAATKLLDWLINYGVKQVLAVGNAGALNDLPENTMLVPTKAIRGEGTSFYYLKPSQFVELEPAYLSQVERAISELGYKYNEIITWTTDGFFRETPKKVAQFRQLGADTVEMECSALAACAQFRKVDFAQILFTGDSLAKMENYDRRGWGRKSYGIGLEVGSQVLSKLNNFK